MSTTKKKKKMTKKKLALIIAIVVAAALLVVFLLPNFFRDNSLSMTSVMRTATVTKGTIETTVVGSGNLTAQNTVDVMIPTDITVESVLVEEGDTVNEGDTLATLDAVSLQTALTSVQSQLSSLDSEINSAKDDTSSKYITTSVSGRVKQIFAESGTETQATISDNGSLLVLSIDGKMKVAFQPAFTDGLSAGSEVTVTLSDGSTVTGSVVSVSADSCVVTMTDNGPACGDSVTVSNSDGAQIGSGTLEINTPIEILGNAGVVSSVDVSLNESVSSGSTLITLTEAGASQEYVSLLSQRKQYEDVLRILLKCAQTNTVTAETSGTIGSVSISGTADPSSSSGSSLSQSSTQAASAMVAVSGSLPESGSSISLLSESLNNDTTPATITPITGITEIYIDHPVTGNTPQTTIMSGNGYTGSIQWSPSDAEFVADTSYTALVTLTADSDHQFAADAALNVAGAQIDPQSIAVSDEAQGNTLTFSAVFPATSKADTAQVSDAGGDSSVSMFAGGSSGASASMPSGGSVSTTISTTSSSDTSTSESSLLQSAFTISTGKADTLTVNIDELDIMSVQTDQDVTIVLDALPDDTFHGKVVKISASGNIQSGVTTYPVTIALTDAGDASIMAGMNATATISIATSEDVLLIPLDALQESGNEQFVLIAGDTPISEESGMGERRTVETGLSDGTNVEIISGLSEGEQIIYAESASTDSSETQSGFPGGMGGNMSGGMPGEMPGGPMGG